MFAGKNHDAVSLTLFPIPYEIVLPEFLLAILCFLAGILVASIALGLKNSHERIQYKKQRKKLAALEDELGLTKAKENILPAVQAKEV